MRTAAPTLHWDDRGRLFLGSLPRHVAIVSPFNKPFAADVPEAVGLIHLPGIERPRSGGTAEVRRAVETAVRDWLAGAFA